MRTRITTAAITAALAFTLTACSSDSEPSEPKASSTADHSSAEAAAGIPAEPAGAKRQALIAALRAVTPALVTDEAEAIDNARNQCSTIAGGGNAELTAKARFSTSDHEVTDAEAKAINTALKTTLCP